MEAIKNIINSLNIRHTVTEITEPFVDEMGVRHEGDVVTERHSIVFEDCRGLKRSVTVFYCDGLSKMIYMPVHIGLGFVNGKKVVWLENDLNGEDVDEIEIESEEDAKRYAEDVRKLVDAVELLR